MATVTRRDYGAEAVEAARSVLLELVNVLGEYRDGVVVVGGWVPELLLSGSPVRHIGSIDVDLALDHQTLQKVGYRTIQRLLLSRGYRQDSQQPYIFFRTVHAGGRDVEVEVDLLAGEYEGTGKSHRTQKVQDVRPRKARGCDLAFVMFTEVRITGVLPGGGKDSATVRVASIVPFLVMKGMALDRMKEKDAWDIYFCLTNYQDGLDTLVQQFAPYIDHSLVREGLLKIADKFATPEHVGPRHVADFEEITDAEERALLQRDAYERVRYLLDGLGITQA